VHPVRQAVDLPALEHAPVPDQRDLPAAEAGGQLADLAGHRVRVGGVAPKHFQRQRPAVLVRQQAHDQLLLAPLPVSVVAEGPQFVHHALQVRAGHVVEVKRGLLAGRVARPEQALFDPGLPLREPVQVGVKVVLAEPGQAQHLGHRLAAGQAHGGQPRALVLHPGQHLPQRQAPLSVGTQDLRHAQLPGQVVEQKQRSDRLALLQAEAGTPGERFGQRAALPPSAVGVQRLADGHLDRLGPVRDVGDRLLDHLALDPPALPQQFPPVGPVAPLVVACIVVHSDHYTRSYQLCQAHANHKSSDHNLETIIYLITLHINEIRPKQLRNGSEGQTDVQDM